MFVFTKPQPPNIPPTCPVLRMAAEADEIAKYYNDCAWSIEMKCRVTFDYSRMTDAQAFYNKSKQYSERARELRQSAAK